MRTKAANEKFISEVDSEPLSSLRRQLERIERSRREAISKLAADAEAERLRKKIRDLGHEPCA